MSALDNNSLFATNETEDLLRSSSESSIFSNDSSFSNISSFDNFTSGNETAEVNYQSLRNHSKYTKSHLKRSLRTKTTLINVSTVKKQLEKVAIYV